MKLSIALSTLFTLSLSSLSKAKKVEDERRLAKENKKKPASIPGVAANTILLAADNNYPPYANLGAADTDFILSGFGPDFALGLNELNKGVCRNLNFEVTETQWAECWTKSDGGEIIGEGLAAGEFHGCMTYTHSAGLRNRYLDFSAPILKDNKAAGLIVPLVGGVPTIDGNSNLDGLKVLDVSGWAPTEDNLAIVTNSCTGEMFTGYDIFSVDTSTGQDNDDALNALLNGDADALWIYADQAEKYSCANAPPLAAWDCTLWDGLGTTFAYIQTGIFDWSRAGTTLTISKKGSGLPEVVNPCIEKFLRTKQYYNLCEKYGFTDVCFPNQYFPDTGGSTTPLYDTPTDELTTSCDSGYCSCP